MKTTLRTDLTVGDICAGFEFSTEEWKGLFGWNGKLTIQPEYQRHYLYAERDGQREREVIKSVMNGYPIGLLYFNRNGEQFEVLDGQQRITSLGRFTKNLFSAETAQGNPHYFKSLPNTEREKFFSTPLTIYICEGTEVEIKAWYKTINIAGLALNKQEIDNAIYSGSFVTAAKKVFSNSTNSNLHMWKYFFRGDVKRQELLRTALEWIVNSSDDRAVEDYMSFHRGDKNCFELEQHFNSVIDWARGIFSKLREEMCQLEWGRFYETYRENSYDADEIAAEVDKLYADDFVKSKRGIFEYLLSGREHTKLLQVRFFEESVKKTAYARQTQAAKILGVSNCPLCVASKTSKSKKIWEYREMDADHVTAWSKGGATTAENCQMLCKAHNRAKGND